MPGKRSSYTANFKLQVVAFAEKSNNSVAARHFSINEKQVREWRKNRSALSEMPKSKKAARGQRPRFHALEERLAAWITDKRVNGLIITRTAIRIRALNLMKMPEFAQKAPKDFVASAGWCDRFMRRNNFTVRARTKLAQKLPSELEDKVEAFQRHVIRLRKEKNFDLSHIGNMDETPVFFDLPSNYTVDSKGAKTVFIKTTGHEKCRFTVVLSCLADGTRLPPTVIFKRKTLPKGAKFPSNIIVRANEKGWMDERGTLGWLEKVWNHRKGAAFKKPSLLVWDSFQAHLTESVKEKCREMNTTVAVIPGGLTSLLQPLDVCLNKPFKDKLRNKWIEWMATEDKAITKGGNVKKVDIETIVHWVKNAWDEISSEMIIRSFKKCCISNSMDGSEDHFVYEDDDDISSELSDAESDYLHPDIPMTEQEFEELFGNSDCDSDFEGFD